jgi:small subunit ribosomal protein S20
LTERGVRDYKHHPLDHASIAPCGGYACDGLSFQEHIFMANTPSAKKAVRKIERRTKINRSRRSQMRTYVRKVEEAIASGDSDAAFAALRIAEPLVMRAAQKGIVHKNTAARKVSRLNRRVNSLGK